MVDVLRSLAGQDIVSAGFLPGLVTPRSAQLLSVRQGADLRWSGLCADGAAGWRLDDNTIRPHGQPGSLVLNSFAELGAPGTQPRGALCAAWDPHPGDHLEATPRPQLCSVLLAGPRRHRTGACLHGLKPALMECRCNAKSPPTKPLSTSIFLTQRQRHYRVTKRPPFRACRGTCTTE
jgi:hypothetical protein